LQVNPNKVTAASNFPVPQAKRQLKRFLEMTGWYQRFINQYSERTFHLPELLRGKDFHWNDNAQVYFEQFKNDLTTAPLLVHTNYDKLFIVQCDVTINGVGALFNAFLQIYKNEEYYLHPTQVSNRQFFFYKCD